MEKIEQYHETLTVVGVTNVGKSTLINTLSKIAEQRINRPLASKGRHWTRLKSRWTTDFHLRYTGDYPSPQMAHYLTAKNLKVCQPTKGNQAQDLSQ